MSDIMADDENTAKAPSYTVVGLNTGYKFNYGNWGMDVFGRVDNLFDRVRGLGDCQRVQRSLLRACTRPKLRRRAVGLLSLRVSKKHPYFIAAGRFYISPSGIIHQINNYFGGIIKDITWIKSISS
jgi:hypothetical protein